MPIPKLPTFSLNKDKDNKEKSTKSKNQQNPSKGSIDILKSISDLSNKIKKSESSLILKMQELSNKLSKIENKFNDQDDIQIYKKKNDDLHKKITDLQSKLKDEEKESLKNISNLQEQKKNLKKDLEEAQRANTDFVSTIRSPIKELKSSYPNPIIDKVVKHSSSKIRPSMNVLIALDTLLKINKNSKDGPNVFKHDFEANIAQFISYSICKDDEFEDQAKEELTKYANSIFKVYEIMYSDASDVSYNQSMHISKDPQADPSSYVEQFITFPVKAKDQNPEHSEIKKALVKTK